MGRVYRGQHLWTTHYPCNSQGSDSEKPDNHDGAESRTDNLGPLALKTVQQKQDHQGDRHDIGLKRLGCTSRPSTALRTEIAPVTMQSP